MIENIHRIRQAQSDFFRSEATLDVSFRRKMLERFAKALDKWEGRLCDALWADLHKSYEEAYLTEISIVKAEVRTHLRKVKQWSRKRRVTTPLKLFPSQSYVVKEPLGNALIIAPWNYPMQLLLNPLVGAISAGCTAVLKPSPYSQYTSEVMQKMIDETFDKEYITMIQGHRDVNQALLAQKFDFIFYTGSPDMGRVVMEAASKNLTPLVLELGGKSPCIVDKDCNLDFAARRIVWGKTINAGQTCVAPDYLMVHRDVKDELLQKMIYYVKKFYGEDQQQSHCYCRIISDKAYQRLTSYFDEGKILYGGKCDAEDRYIQFTLLDLGRQSALESVSEYNVMKDEIFGPILPIIEFDYINKVSDFIANRPKPLALYYFGNAAAMDVLNETTSGGVCINDTILHVANEHLPFGGVGDSGMGKYHSQESFMAFSNRRAVLKSSNKIDFAMKYPPYDKMELIKKLM